VHKVILDFVRSGDLRAFQSLVDMKQVHEPSSTIHRCTMILWMVIGIWETMVDGNRGVL
jgi:hypothetical protein